MYKFENLKNHYSFILFKNREFYMIRSSMEQMLFINKSYFTDYIYFCKIMIIIIIRNNTPPISNPSLRVPSLVTLGVYYYYYYYLLYKYIISLCHYYCHLKWTLLFNLLRQYKVTVKKKEKNILYITVQCFNI